MELQDLLSNEGVNFNLKSKTKDDVINELIDLLEKQGKINDREKFKKAIMKREEEYSTAIEYGIAIPHGKDDSVVSPALVFGISKEGVDYESLDGELSHIFFMIAVPENCNDMHLRILSTISRKLMYEEVREKLLNASCYEDVIKSFI